MKTQNTLILFAAAILLMLESCEDKGSNPPTVFTDNITAITETTATGGGNVTENGGFEVTERGICWDTSANPKTYNNKVAAGSGTGSFTAALSGLKPNTTYYVSAYAINEVGTSYGFDKVFTSENAGPVLAIGDFYQGGIIGYIFEPGDPGYYAGEQHGLIVAPVDQDSATRWFNGNYYLIGGTDWQLGSGAANTQIIVSSQGTGIYAALICSELVLGGYSDWYLPSKADMYAFWENKNAINGGFTGGANAYWSSTEDTYTTAFRQDFYGGNYNQADKINQCFVRAARSF